MKRALLFTLVVVSATLIAIVAALANLQSANSQTPSPSSRPVTVPSASEPTELRVYVLARGGKFIGDDIGGAEVTLRDARTGEFLASGRTQGGSGTADLMSVERTRTEPISVEDASVFTTTLALDAPRLIQFEAYGPLGGQGSANRVTATEWVLPASLAENKIILEIPGLNVNILNPPTHFLPAAKPPLEIPIRVNVTMMCGCPIAPDVPWKPEDFVVKALIIKPDKTRELIDLQFDPNAPDDAPSQFIGSYTALQPGFYQLIVMAWQPGQDNAGSNHFTFIIPSE